MSIPRLSIAVKNSRAKAPVADGPKPQRTADRPQERPACQCGSLAGLDAGRPGASDGCPTDRALGRAGARAGLRRRRIEIAVEGNREEVLLLAEGAHVFSQYSVAIDGRTTRAGSSAPLPLYWYLRDSA